MTTTQDREMPGGLLLSMRNIHKSYGTNRVLRGVDLDLAPGEIVGLMGPNGAGKSTLIGIVAGLHRADKGDINFLGGPVNSLAGRQEVGIIHQDLGLIDSLSILDNVRLGAPPLSLVGPILNRQAEIRAAYDALERVNMPEISVLALLETLSPGEKALVALARLLYRGARIVILDETTASLPPTEAKWLIDHLRASALSGTAVLMVSHKLAEIRSAADRLVFLSDGLVDSVVSMRDIDAHESHLVDLILGDDRDNSDDKHHITAAKLAELTGAPEGNNPGRPPNTPALIMTAAHTGHVGPIDLHVNWGEAVGLTGPAGSGVNEIALLAAGFLSLDAGKLVIGDRVRTAFLPAQRDVDGNFADLPVLWNMTVSALGKLRGRIGLLSIGKERKQAELIVNALRVVPPDLALPVSSLSGGNQQKVLFGRMILQDPDLLVLCEPTRGVDLRTRGEIYSLIRALKQQGCAILIVSSDPEDILATCERIGLVSDGAVERFEQVSQLESDTLAEIL